MVGRRGVEGGGSSYRGRVLAGIGNVRSVCLRREIVADCPWACLSSAVAMANSSDDDDDSQLAAARAAGKAALPMADAADAAPAAASSSVSGKSLKQILLAPESHNGRSHSS